MSSRATLMASPALSLSVSRLAGIIDFVVEGQCSNVIRDSVEGTNTNKPSGFTNRLKRPEDDQDVMTHSRRVQSYMPPHTGATAVSERFRAARDGDDAGAGDVDEAERLHQVDEGVQLLGRAGELEDEGLDRGVDDAGAEHVGDAQGLHALVAGAAHLHQGQLALEVRAFRGEIADAVDGHEAVQLVLDLLDDH